MGQVIQGRWPQSVHAYGRKGGECVVCGKSATRQRTFILAVKDGELLPEVREEVERRREVWELLPLKHAKCE